MTAPRAVRIALCDDQALVLRGLSSLLADLGVEIALESTDAERLLAALPQRPVDLIVSDIRLKNRQVAASRDVAGDSQVQEQTASYDLNDDIPF